MKDYTKRALDKKSAQLGMNVSTASGRLVKDLLYSFVEQYHPNCFRCNEPLTRETFSIEHKVAWLDSDDPIKLFFDLKNIDFSHQLCNTLAGRKPFKKYNTEEERKEALREYEVKRWNKKSAEEKVANRKARYQKYGY